jgi:hypothetical protein
MGLPPGGAFASNLVAKERRKVRYMYREQPDDNWDSGWRFFSGTEDQAYVDNPSNLGIYALSTIAEIDPDIVPLLNYPPPCAFEREQEDELFREVRGFQFRPGRDWIV